MKKYFVTNCGSTELEYVLNNKISRSAVIVQILLTFRSSIDAKNDNYKIIYYVDKSEKEVNKSDNL